MDNSAVDPLNDTPTLPELSFDDLLDDSPVKDDEDDDNQLSDPLELNQELNTPGPKKPRFTYVGRKKDESLSTPKSRPHSTSSQASFLINEISTTTPTRPSSTVKILNRDFLQRTNTTSTTASASAIAATPNLLNGKNFFSKTIPTTIKIVPKTTVGSGNKTGLVTGNKTTVATVGRTIAPANPPATALTTTTTSNNASVAAANKTTIKASNGQIYYLQKSIGGLSAVRLAATSPSPSKATPTPTSVVATTTTNATSTAGSNKPVSIQVLSSSDGTLIPVKSSAAATVVANSSAISTAAGGAKSTFTLSPTMSAKIAGKKIITNSGNQVVIKAASSSLKLSVSSATATTSVAISTLTKATASTATATTATTNSSSSLSATATTTETATTTKAEHKLITTASNTNKTQGKIVVQSSNGKHIVVSNPHLIKLSPKATTPTGGSRGHLQAIRIPGKPGLQYVRVLPTSKSGAAAAAASNGSGTKNVTTAGATGGGGGDGSSGALTATSTTMTTATSMKILNSGQKNFAVVRTVAGTTKMLLTQSPKNFSPVTSKVQKTIVTVPTLRKITDTKSSPNINAVTSDNDSPTNDDNTQTLNNSNDSSNTNNTTNSAGGSCNLGLIPKHKISNINAQIQRITSGESETKKPSALNRVVVMSRSMLRNNNNIPPLYHASKVNANVGGDNSDQSVSEVDGAVGAAAPSTSASSSAPKKLFSVLKAKVVAAAAAAVSSGNVPQPHPVDIKTNAELKSLIICGQARALMSHQLHQQQKAQQILQKQRFLHQQHQQLQQQMQRQRLQQQQLDKQKKQQRLEFQMVQELKLKQELKLQQQQQKKHQQHFTSNTALTAIKLEPLDPTSDFSVKDENVGIRRKHCNCSKSQCLKLYCDCFANGEFCQDCNCKDCFNNLQYEDERQKAIRNCLERNPSAFKPKITTAQDHGDMRLHNKGCNCKRSGCLKNYCECYEAKIPCSSNCRCFGCRNVEDRPDLDMDPIDSKIFATMVGGASGSGGGGAAGGGTALMTTGQKRSYEKMDKNNKELVKDNAARALVAVNSNRNDIANCVSVLTPAEKQQCNFITQEVIDATIQCMISQADECEKNGLPDYQTEKMVMEELGRCLVEIIDFSIRNTDTSYSQE